MWETPSRRIYPVRRCGVAAPLLRSRRVLAVGRFVKYGYARGSWLLTTAARDVLLGFVISIARWVDIPMGVLLHASTAFADFFGVLLLRAFSSESFNTTIHGCWTADARPLQSRMIRFRKEEMLLNFLVRYSLLVISPLKEFAEVPSVFTVTFSVFFLSFSLMSRGKSSLDRHCRSNLPRTVSTVPVQRAVVGRGVRLSLSSLNDGITHATVVMIVGKHVSLCGYGEVCAFAFRVSRVSPEEYQRIYSSWEMASGISVFGMFGSTTDTVQTYDVVSGRRFGLGIPQCVFSCSLFVVLSAARPLLSRSS